MLCNFRYRNLAKDFTGKRKHIEGRKKYMLKVVYDQNLELVTKEFNHFGGIASFFRDWAPGTLTIGE